MAISDWTIIVYYDLQPYWSDMRVLAAGITELKHKCSELQNVNACNSIYAHFLHVHAELQAGNELINHSRQRRSPLDIVGNVANSLFGVLDSKYAEDMSKVINDVKSNEDVLMMLLKNQTSILDSTINVVRKSNSATNDRIRNIEQQIDALTRERGKYQGNYLQQAFMILTAQLTLLANGMQRMQNEITNVLTDIRHRTISPMLVSPQQLRDQLDQIREHIPPDQQLPVSSNDVIQLYRIMHAEGTTTTDHVIFKITLPLVSTAQQEVFSVIPIPAWKAGSWHEFKLKTRIITVNAHRDQFMGLTTDEFDQCLQLPKDEHICVNHQATFSVDNRCEFQLFNNKTETEFRSNCRRYAREFPPQYKWKEQAYYHSPQVARHATQKSALVHVAQAAARQKQHMFVLATSPR
nr:uncharacterized protein LOC121502842 [Drosophila kikkawai]